MKKLYAILVINWCLSVPSIHAQTTVSGFINANTTWTLSGSPYIVTGNVLLSQGFTLTIDPGVVVKFGTNNALQIDGQLIAIGTPNQRIVFTSNQANPQPGDWAKLHFSDFSTDAVYDAQGNYVSGTILSYCDVLYAGSLMFGAVDIQESSPYFNHCRIMYSSWSGINFNANANHFTIDSSRISDNAKRGIYYEGEHFLMRSDTFISNAEGAIHVQQQYGLTQSRILNSFFRFNYNAITGSPRRTTIMGSIFKNNTGNIVTMAGTRDTISCNTIANNTGGLAVYWANGLTGGVIHNNLIEYNSNPAGPSVFSISSGTGGIGDTLYISSNRVRHNSSPGNSCCAFYIYYLNSFTANSLQVYNNEFTENDGVNFMKFYGQQNGNASFDFIYMNGNTFINPLCTYELNNGIPYGSPNISVDGNYWGSTSTSYIDGVIYDYFDLANFSVVYYTPILTQPVLVDTTCQPFQLPNGVGDSYSITGNNFQVFPNPTYENITISFNDPSRFDEVLIEILNPLGEVVFSEQVLNGTAKAIALPGASGVYIVRVITEEEIYIGKIVKE